MTKHLAAFVAGFLLTGILHALDLASTGGVMVGILVFGAGFGSGMFYEYRSRLAVLQGARDAMGRFVQGQESVADALAPIMPREAGMLRARLREMRRFADG